MPAIFISHSSRDQKAADDIKSALARLGFERVFLDFDKETGIGAGEHWEKRLYEELSRCHAVILVLTPSWLASKWCFAELTQARALGKTILPIICEPVGERLILPEVQAVDLMEWNADGLSRLESRLRAITNELARGFTFDSNRPPYPGIHAFEAEDAAIYFGRDEETRAALERLDARRTRGGARLLVIIGASGSGKSSLLKAGVLPQLARRRTQWVLLPPMRPERAPLEALAKAIAQKRNEPEAWRAWHERLRAPDAARQLVELVKDLRVGEARGATVLLPIDQLEELFTIAEPHERAAALGLLAAILDPGVDLPVLVVATGRADVLQGLLEASALAPLTETMSLLPVPLDRVPRLVDGPAAVAALVIEPGLTDRIARDVESPEALPLLAHALRLLYERCAHDKRLTLAGYVALGDPARELNPVQNSVRLKADQAIQGLKPSGQELAALRDAFVPHLVRVRLDDGRRVRQPAPLAALPREAERLVRALIEARLLTVRSNHAWRPGAAGPAEGEAVIEVAHEALFKAWPTLEQWLTEEHVFLTDLERIRDAHEVWRGAPDDQKSNALLGGLLLGRARDWLIKFPRRFVGRDMEKLREFVSASAAVAEAARAQRERLWRRIQVLTTAALVVVTAIAGLAAYLWLEAQAQRDKSLVAQSSLLADLASQQTEKGDAVSGALIAIEALPDRARGVRRPQSVEALRALYGAFYRRRELAILAGHGKGVTDLAISPDGKRLLSASADQTAVLWDLDSRRPLMTVGEHSFEAEQVLFNPNGRSFLTRDANGNVRVFTADGSAELVRFERERDGPILDCAFNPDGSLLAVTIAGDKQFARVLDTADWKIAKVLLDESTGASARVAFNSDGSLLATERAIWRTRDWTLLATLDPQPGLAQSLAFSPDSKWLVMSTFGAKVQDQDSAPNAMIWEVATGKLARVLGGHITNVRDADVANAAFSPTQPLVLLAGSDGVRVFNRETGRLKFVLHEGSFVNRAIFSADGNRIATAGSDKTARIFDAESGKQLAVLAGHEDKLTRVAFLGDGSRVLTASRDGSVRIWRADPLGEMRAGPAALPLAHVPSSDPTRVVGWNATGDAVLVWDLASGREVDAVGNGDLPLAVALDAGKARIERMFARTAGATGYLWDRATGRKTVLLHSQDPREREVGPRSSDAVKGFAAAADFSPDGSKLVIASESPRLVDARTGRLLVELKGHTGAVHHAVFSADGKLVATAGEDGTVIVWDADTGARRSTIEHKSGEVRFVALDAEARRIATASTTGKSRIWDALSGKPLLELDGEDVYRLRFDGTGRLLAGVGKPVPGPLVQVVIWSAETGRQVAVVPVSPGESFFEDASQIENVAFVRNGAALITHAEEGGARLWPLFSEAGQLIEQAIAAAPRCLRIAQRVRLGLAAQPPAWCIEMQKWPYQTEEWRSWLGQTKAGRSPPVPEEREP